VAKVVILGAGLTGLNAAYHFEQQNFFDFKIFEKESSSGGLLRSFKQDGFTFDFTGHLLHINNSEFYNFLNETADINNFFSQQRKSCIYTNNRFINYPFQQNLYNLPEQIKFECIKGYINRKKIKRHKSFYDWVLKYFGSGIGKHFFFPYNKKLLSFDLKQITPSWTGRFVPQVNLDNILNSALSPNNQSLIGYNSSFYYPKHGGIQFLIDKLENKIKSKIHKNYNAIKINLKNKTIYFENGQIEKFEKLITTIPLNELLNNIEETSNLNLTKNHSNLICNSVINFNLGFNINIEKEKHWLYYPEKKHPFYRIGFWNNICKTSTPKNKSAIYGEVSFIKRDKTNKQINNLTEKSINNFMKTFGISENSISTKKILNLPYAYVIYNFWREKNLKKIHNQLNNNSIFSVGRYGEWKYSSMQEAFLDGKNVANKILGSLNFPVNIKKDWTKNESRKILQG
jgi:protoporphyrinogen oxidase